MFKISETLQFDVYTIVLMICEVVLVLLGVLQWYLADVTVRYIAARDDIYTIPSGKFKWRPEILSSHSIKHERF
ncbi:unnamed protein product [Anisakis simplex]|uniref:Transmembrane protein n=1 Tax=Anisakis simplex TaxID=6269 RepID=A0A0M3JJA8_ANISI|nr:unnamed protein product [Anisakis simplex]